MADCIWCKKKLTFFSGTGMAFGMLCDECYDLLQEAKKGESMAINTLCNYIEKVEDKSAQEYLNSLIENAKEVAQYKELKKEEERIEEEKKIKEREKIDNAKNVLLNTGYSFEGYNIVEYRGIVSTESVLGTGIFSELSLSINDFFGVTSNTYQSKFAEAKQIVLSKLKMIAALEGANAIIGIDFDILTLSNNAIVVSANGTAVVIEKKE